MNGHPHYARLIPVKGGLAFESSYDTGLVSAFKAQIPVVGRQWDSQAKRWLIDPAHAETCARLVEAYLGITLAVPERAVQALTETRLVLVEYLGRCKYRGSESSAFGWVDGGWSVLFPESVLRTWFDVPGEDRPGDKPTLYAMLAIKPGASQDEIKKAFRRLAMQWHPDHCKEPDAAERFKVIYGAYEVLKNERLRKKYDAGLVLEASLKQPRQPSWISRIDPTLGYRAPLRCGYLLVEGQEHLARFIVSRILQWEDVTNEQGQVMVVSWPRGAEHFEVTWA